jgi:hypothetical protein
VELHGETMLPEWIDYNGHMQVAYDLLAFDHSTDSYLGWRRVAPLPGRAPAGPGSDPPPPFIRNPLRWRRSWCKVLLTLLSHKIS